MLGSGTASSLTTVYKRLSVLAYYLSMQSAFLPVPGDMTGSSSSLTSSVCFTQKYTPLCDDIMIDDGNSDCDVPLAASQRKEGLHVDDSYCGE